MPTIPINIVSYVFVAAFAAVLAGYWQIFTKSGRQGWEVLLPGWNLVALTRIIGRPAWWVLGLLPGLGCLGWALVRWDSWVPWAVAAPGLALAFWVHWRVSLDLARSFGRSRRFGWRLALLPFVYVPALGFGYSEYAGPKAQKSTRPAAPGDGRDAKDSNRA